MPNDVPRPEDAVPDLSDLSIGRERDVFLRELLRDLASTLEQVVGLEEAQGFIAIVGARMGDRMNADYREALVQPTLDPNQVAGALVDLKRRIEGGFKVVELTSDRIVLRNSRCPFGAYVQGQPALCMMTSNVFGRIVAENLGYARVGIDASFAMGNDHCHVVIDLNPDKVTCADPHAREYYKVGV